MPYCLVSIYSMHHSAEVIIHWNNDLQRGTIDASCLKGSALWARNTLIIVINILVRYFIVAVPHSLPLCYHFLLNRATPSRCCPSSKKFVSYKSLSEENRYYEQRWQWQHQLLHVRYRVSAILPLWLWQKQLCDWVKWVTRIFRDNSLPEAVVSRAKANPSIGNPANAAPDTQTVVLCLIRFVPACTKCYC